MSIVLVKDVCLLLAKSVITLFVINPKLSQDDALNDINVEGQLIDRSIKDAQTGVTIIKWIGQGIVSAIIKLF